MTDFVPTLTVYLNANTEGDFKNLADINNFLNWIDKRSLTDKKKQRIIDYVNQNRDAFDALWQIVLGIMFVKDDIINQMETQSTDVESYLGNEKGGEGYVIASPKGDIKLVPRKRFSKINRAAHNRSSDLNEKNNAFKDFNGDSITMKINECDVEPTIRWLESITELSLIDNNNTIQKINNSNFLDLNLNKNDVPLKELLKNLSIWLLKSDLKPKEYIKANNSKIHFKSPIKGDEGNGFVQVNFNFE